MESDQLNFIVEANIPFAKGLLEPYGNVSYLTPAQINADAMSRCNALITRTRTHCDAALLANSPCTMIASATIGLDHIDLDYCRNRGIEVANAPGCNAPAVAQYVLASIIALRGANNLRGIRLGIVGVGHVGRIVESWAGQLGMTVMKCDPPRQRMEGPDGFVGMDEIARNADIITFHTPYTRKGPDPTHHLADADFLQSLSRKPVIINSARGQIVDNEALCRALDNGTVSHAIIDCWENEPQISRQLLQRAFIATPHIAGYSREGKIRATAMAIEAVGRHFGFPPPEISAGVSSGPRREITADIISSSYDPLTDTAALRANPEAFESLRNNYNLRREP